jgi:hypothetical protein
MSLPKLQQSPPQMSILKKVVLLFFLLFVILQVVCIVEFYCLMAPTVLLVKTLGGCLVVMLVLHFRFMVLQLEGDVGWKMQTNQTFQSNGRIKYLDSKFVCSFFFDFGLLH